MKIVDLIDHVASEAGVEKSAAKKAVDAVFAGIVGAAAKGELENVNAALRVKGREANKAARTAAARISELEQQVAQLERKATSSAEPAKSSAKPANAASARRQIRSADPGDVVPPNVVARNAESLDDEPAAALDDPGND